MSIRSRRAADSQGPSWPAGLHYLARRVPAVTLYVEGDNTAALHTYANLGFERYRADVAYGFPGN